MKKILSLILSLSLTVGLLSIHVLGATFSDVPSNTWYYEGVTYCSNKGLVSGYKDGTFQPNRSITRAELAVICSQGLNLTEQGANTFSDVKSSDWFAPYVLKCSKAGIMKGYENGKFNPNYAVSREQAAVVAAQVYGLGKSSGNTSFSDNDKISSWALSSVKSMTNSGLAAGKGNNRFCPKDSVTRAEVAVVINSANKKGFQPSRKSSTDNNDNSNNASNKAYGVKSDGTTCYGTFKPGGGNDSHTFTFKADRTAVYGIRIKTMDKWSNTLHAYIYNSKDKQINNGNLGNYYNVIYGSLSFEAEAGETYRIVIHGNDNYYEFEFYGSNKPQTMKLGYSYSNTLHFTGQSDKYYFVAPASKPYGVHITFKDPKDSASITCLDSRERFVFSKVVSNEGTATFNPVQYGQGETLKAGETYTFVVEYLHNDRNDDAEYTVYIEE